MTKVVEAPSLTQMMALGSLAKLAEHISSMSLSVPKPFVRCSRGWGTEAAVVRATRVVRSREERILLSFFENLGKRTLVQASW